MKIEVLGTGCAKCKTLEKIVKDAVAQIGGFHSVEKVEDIQKIMDYGVMNTPALVVEGEVKSTGKVLSKDEVIAILENSAKS
ncbi:MAG: thioredoxin family protein [Sulfurospirillaceae bacterium]|nr:thioredoxin family protein [Sulfurospirillaceae bacterium]